MGTIRAGSIEKSFFLLEKGAPYQVIEREFVNPGKGSAFVKLKLKNLIDGSVQRVTHKSQDNMEQIDVNDISAQYLYADGLNYFFMHNKTFEQFEIPIASMEDKIYFLLEGNSYRLVEWEERILEIKLPPKVDLVVSYAEDGIKGDTVTGATKIVRVETGLEVRVPIFIKQGEKIRINPETKEYQERVNN